MFGIDASFVGVGVILSLMADASVSLGKEFEYLKS